MLLVDDVDNGGGVTDDAPLAAAPDVAAAPGLDGDGIAADDVAAVPEADEGAEYGEKKGTLSK